MPNKHISIEILIILLVRNKLNKPLYKYVIVIIITFVQKDLAFCTMYDWIFILIIFQLNHLFSNLYYVVKWYFSKSKSNEITRKNI